MKKQYKTFDDLVFEQWGGKNYSARDLKRLGRLGQEQAVINFDNGYGVSILFGKGFYSNGFDSYELAVLKGNTLVYPEDICPDHDVLGKK